MTSDNQFTKKTFTKSSNSFTDKSFTKSSNSFAVRVFSKGSDVWKGDNITASIYGIGDMFGGPSSSYGVGDNLDHFRKKENYEISH